MADLALHRQQQGAGLLDFVERAGQRLLRNFGVIAEGKQDLALAFEFLHQVEFQLGAPGNFEDLEQGDQRDMVFHRPVRRGEMGDLVEQVFKPQQRANALAERVFVSDHTPAGSVKFTGL